MTLPRSAGRHQVGSAASAPSIPNQHVPTVNEHLFRPSDHPHCAGITPGWTHLLHKDEKITREELWGVFQRLETIAGDIAKLTSDWEAFAPKSDVIEALAAQALAIASLNQAVETLRREVTEAFGVAFNARVANPARRQARRGGKT
jgi:hypothetical protein